MTLQILQISFLFLFFSTLKVLHERGFSMLKASRAKKAENDPDKYNKMNPNEKLQFQKLDC